MSVEVREHPEITFAGFRNDGPPDQIASVWEKFGAFMNKRPELINEKTQWLSPFYNETPPYSYAAITVEDTSALPPELEVNTIPAGKYAGMVHIGPYENLKTAWTTFCSEVIPASGLEPDNRPCFEVYLNDPETTPAAELQTQMWIAVK